MCDDAAPITAMPGLGPTSAGWLAEVGIETAGDLRALGAVAAYRRVKHAFPRHVSLNMLWGLHAALSGIRWTDIDAGTKARLKAEAGV